MTGTAIWQVAEPEWFVTACNVHTNKTLAARLSPNKCVGSTLACQLPLAYYTRELITAVKCFIVLTLPMKKKPGECFNFKTDTNNLKVRDVIFTTKINRETSSILFLK